MYFGGWVSISEVFFGLLNVKFRIVRLILVFFFEWFFDDDRIEFIKLKVLFIIYVWVELNKVGIDIFYLGNKFK